MIVSDVNFVNLTYFSEAQNEHHDVLDGRIYSILKLEAPGGSGSQGSYFGSMSSEGVAPGPAK